MNKDIEKFDAIFKPRSIAVVGATMREGALGRTIIKNLITNEFSGKIFPVNPGKEVIYSFKCFPRVSDIPDPVDLAIIIVRKELVLDVVKDCGEKGVKGLVVLTAGFREMGKEGKEIEDQLLKLVRKYKMRMIGPNCMGVINTDPDIRMDATFSPETPLVGNMGFLTQSGGLGVAIISQARRYNLGLSMFASIGNKADISGNDLLEYWEHDPRTDVILMYLESFGNSGRFTQIAKRVSKHKPIIAVKAGRTVAGAKAASSHTGAIAGADIASTAILEQCGVIRVTTIAEMFDLAMAFSRKKYPKGKKVAIISNGGGPAIMAVDACTSVGLDVAPFSDETQKKIRNRLEDIAATSNPVDMIGIAGPKEYEDILKIVDNEKDVDSILAISVTPPTLINPLAVINAIEKTANSTDKPLLTVVMGKDVMRLSGTSNAPDLPAYEFPEPPARALAAMLKYRNWQQIPEGSVKKFKVNKDKVRKVLDKEIDKSPHYLSNKQVYDILSAYKMPIIKTTFAADHESASEYAEKIGFPVVMKAVAKDLIHKSDVGGVRIDLRNKGEVIEAFYDIKKIIEKAKKGSFEGVVLQKMIKTGKEVILGMTSMPQFGSLLMFGLGGIFVEVIKDVQFRIAPLTDIGADEMIRSIKGFPILEGIRGEKGVDISTIKDCLQKLSQLVTDFDCIQAIDINPFMVNEDTDSSFIVDARILVGK
ncbi:acetate--CoA ligase family protein [candidate division KSB1 bacterium]